MVVEFLCPFPPPLLQRIKINKRSNPINHDFSWKRTRKMKRRGSYVSNIEKNKEARRLPYFLEEQIQNASPAQHIIYIGSIRLIISIAIYMVQSLQSSNTYTSIIIMRWLLKELVLGSSHFYSLPLVFPLHLRMQSSRLSSIDSLEALWVQPGLKLLQHQLHIFSQLLYTLAPVPFQVLLHPLYQHRKHLLHCLRRHLHKLLVVPHVQCTFCHLLFIIWYTIFSISSALV